MTDSREQRSVERLIAELQLPDPTPELDRRIETLLATRNQPKPRGGISVLAMAAGTLVAGVVALAFAPTLPRKPEVNRAVTPQSPPPIVKTVQVAIPILGELPTDSFNEQDRLFPTDTIVVSTKVQNGEQE